MFGGQRIFQFFGRRVGVTSVESAVVDELAALYPDHVVAEPGVSGIDAELRIVGLPDGGARIEWGRRSIMVREPDALARILHLCVINAAAARVRGAVVLHAGSAAIGDRAVALTGPSGAGKSTLTMALVACGWGLLADDFTIIDRAGNVQPFSPLAHLTDRSIELLGLESLPRRTRLGRGGKWAIDANAAHSANAGAVASLAAVFILGPALNRRPDEGQALTWHLEIDRLSKDLVAAIEALPDVASVREWPRRDAAAPPQGPESYGSHQLEIAIHPGGTIVGRLDPLLAAHDVSVLSARSGPERVARFAEEPTLERLDAHLALPELLSHALCLSGRRFIDGTDEADVRDTLGRLAACMDGVPIYRLWPGPIAATTRLVADVLGT